MNLSQLSTPALEMYRYLLAVFIKRERVLMNAHAVR